MECDICEQLRGPVYKCDICRSRNCKACGQLTSSEVKVLELNSRVMIFNCKKCRDSDHIKIFQELVISKDKLVQTKDKLIETKDYLIRSMEVQMNSLKKEVKDLKNKNQHVETEREDRLKYSEVIGKKCNEVLIVKPKDKVQVSSVTKAVIQENVELEKIKVGVSNMKYVKDGGVAISCERKEDLMNVSNNIQKKLGKDYEVNIPDKKCPKIKIINVEQKLFSNENDFIEKIILQNAITTGDEDRKISIVKHFQGKKCQDGKESVVLEVDSKTYGLITEKEKLSIGWKSYRFFDYINVVQCFKCSKFGHIAKDCRCDGNICPRCTGEHQLKECKSQDTVCANCKYAKEVLKVPNINYNHPAYDKNCEAYKRIYRELEQRINYPSIFKTKI